MTDSGPLRRLEPDRLGDHVDRLYRAAWALTGNPHDAEDLVQDTYARVLARPRFLRHGDDLGYLLRALTNQHSSRHRRSGARPAEVSLQVAAGDAGPAFDPRSPEAAFEVAELFAAIAGLAPDARAAVVAVDVGARAAVSEDIGTAIARAASTVSAPPDLRRRVEQARPPRARLVATAVVLGTAAVLAGILSSASPTIEQVADAALQPPTRTAPQAHAYAAGYRAVGARTDRVGGRRAVTVVYRRGAARVHYAIVEGKPLELPGSRRVPAGDLRLALERYGDVNVVAWHTGGRTCVLASRAVGLDGLVRLATRA